MGNCKYGDPRRKVHQRVTWVAVSSSSAHTTWYKQNTEVEHRTLNTKDTSETSQHDTHKTQNTWDRLDTENTANTQNTLTQHIAHTPNNTKLRICTMQSSVQGHDHTLLQWYTCLRLMLAKGPNKHRSLNAYAELQS